MKGEAILTFNCRASANANWSLASCCRHRSPSCLYVTMCSQRHVPIPNPKCDNQIDTFALSLSAASLSQARVPNICDTQFFFWTLIVFASCDMLIVSAIPAPLDNVYTNILKPICFDNGKAAPNLLIPSAPPIRYANPSSCSDLLVRMVWHLNGTEIQNETRKKLACSCHFRRHRFFFS